MVWLDPGTYRIRIYANVPSPSDRLHVLVDLPTGEPVDSMWTHE
jgi:hypothetical protein